MPSHGAPTWLRYLSDEVAREIRQPFVTDNRPDAGGNVGTQAAARRDAKRGPKPTTPRGYVAGSITRLAHGLPRQR